MGQITRAGSPGYSRSRHEGARPRHAGSDLELRQATMSTTRMASLATRASLCALLAIFGWAYWTTLADIRHHWDIDPLYSHGYLVPGFATLLLWLRRDLLKGRDLRP